MLLSNCSSASTEIPEELAAGGRPSSAAVRATSEQAVPSADPIEPMTMEIATEQRTPKQVPPEAPGVEHVATEEKRVPEPRQEAPEQSTATPSTQEGVLPDAAVRGKTPVVVVRPKSSRGYAEARTSQ
jgi:hypothetical protein